MTPKLITRRTALLTTTAATLSACVDPNAIGRGDRTPLEGGIGGTGIVGLLTDFGSLIINGERVLTDRSTRYTNAFGEISPDSLARGNSLTIEANGPKGSLTAKRVHVTHPVIGLISEQSRNGARLTINGITVKVEPHARRSASRGQRVAVSGAWNGVEVIASQISRLPDTTPGVIAGAVRPSTRPQSIRIGTAEVQLPDFVLRPEQGSFATVTGEMSGDTFQVSHLAPNRFTGAAGAIKELLVEGYLDPTNDAPGFEVSGLGHSFAPDTRLEAFANGRVVFGGPYTGKFAASWGLPLPASYRQRQDVMRVLLTDPDRLERQKTR